MKKVIAIIPARFSSQRFPGKPLKLLYGKPIVCRVLDAVKDSVDRVVVATDDERIYNTVFDYGAEVVMTSSNHTSGTERIIEAFEKIGHNEDIVINVQGDEPFISQKQIRSIISCFDDTTIDIATLYEIFPKDTDNEKLFDPSKVKIVKSKNDIALYFSRLPIPYQRDMDKNWCSIAEYYKHIGLYAFSSRAISNIKRLGCSMLENSEKLEQLRWIEYGMKIKVVKTDISTIGIDTPEDLLKAEEYLRQQNNDR